MGIIGICCTAGVDVVTGSCLTAATVVTEVAAIFNGGDVVEAADCVIGGGGAIVFACIDPAVDTATPAFDATALLAAATAAAKLAAMTDDGANIDVGMVELTKAD